MEFIATYRDSDGQTRTKKITAPSEQDVFEHFEKRKIELIAIDRAPSNHDGLTGSSSRPLGTADTKQQSTSQPWPKNATGGSTSLPDALALMVRIVLAIAVAILFLAFVANCYPSNRFRTDYADAAAANAIEYLATLFPIAVLLFGALFALALTTLFQMMRRLIAAVESNNK